MCWVRIHLTTVICLIIFICSCTVTNRCYTLKYRWCIAETNIPKNLAMYRLFKSLLNRLLYRLSIIHLPTIGEGVVPLNILNFMVCVDARWSKISSAKLFFFGRKKVAGGLRGKYKIKKRKKNQEKENEEQKGTYKWICESKRNKGKIDIYLYTKIIDKRRE